MTNPGDTSIPPTTPEPGGPQDAQAPTDPAQQWPQPPEAPLVPPSGPSRPAPQAQSPQPYLQPQAYQPQQPYPPAPPAAPAYPYAAPAWTPPAPGYGGWAQPQPTLGQEPADALRKARTALGWAIGAAVGAFLALGIAVVALLMGGAGMVDDGMFFESLRGEVSGLSEGDALSGDDLERPLVDVLDEWYFDVADIACPDTASVAVSTAVVCTGDVEGMPWTGVVYFEDTEGRFVVLEL